MPNMKYIESKMNVMRRIMIMLAMVLAGWIFTPAAETIFIIVGMIHATSTEILQ